MVEAPPMHNISQENWSDALKPTAGLYGLWRPSRTTTDSTRFSPNNYQALPARATVQEVGMIVYHILCEKIEAAFVE